MAGMSGKAGKLRGLSALVTMVCECPQAHYDRIEVPARATMSFIPYLLDAISSEQHTKLAMNTPETLEAKEELNYEPRPEVIAALNVTNCWQLLLL